MMAAPNPSKPLKLTMLGAFPPQAQGIPDYCGALAEALARQCEVTALGFRHMYPKRLFPGTRRHFDDTKIVPAREQLHLNHTLDWYRPHAWTQSLKNNPPDILHLQWWSLALFPVAYQLLRYAHKRHIPTVLTVHNVLPHEPGRLFLSATETLLRHATRILVHNEPDRDQLRESYGTPLDKISTVTHGAFPHLCRPMPREQACRELNLPPDRQYLLFFGTIRSYKGLKTLLHAFTVLQAYHPNIDLIIAGCPWEKWADYDRILSANKLHNRVHTFLDYIPEARTGAFFSAADLVAFPYTHFDAQSGACARALPYKTPMLVSDAGGLPDWVNRSTEWTLPPNDAILWGERMIYFFEHHAQQQRAFQAIADQVLEKTGWDAIARQHMQVYETIRSI